MYLCSTVFVIRQAVLVSDGHVLRSQCACAWPRQVRKYFTSVVSRCHPLLSMILANASPVSSKSMARAIRTECPESVVFCTSSTFSRPTLINSYAADNMNYFSFGSVVLELNTLLRDACSNLFATGAMEKLASSLNIAKP